MENSINLESADYNEIINFTQFEGGRRCGFYDCLFFHGAKI